MNEGGVLNFFKSIIPIGLNKRTEQKTIPDITETEVNYIESELDKYLAFHQNDREREDSAHRFYTALDFGQWPSELRTASTQKDLSQYNFVHRKINNGVGVIYKNPMDLDFVPIDGKYSDLTLIAKEVYYADKFLMNWDQEFVDGLKDAFIHATMFRLTVDNSQNVLGNLKLEKIQAGHYLTDPEWDGLTMKDCNRLITVSFMNPREIMSFFDAKSDLIESRIMEMAAGSSFDDQSSTNSIPQFDINTIYGQKYRVITYHHIEYEKSVKRVALDFFGRATDIPTPPEDLQTSQAQKSWVDEWLTLNNINKDSLFEQETIEKVYYVTTVCPDMDPVNPLESRLGYIQAGRLPFFNLSFSRHNGRNMGMVELIKDAQTNFNKRMSLISEIIAKSAKGGKIFEPNAFGNDITKIEKIKTDMAKPGFIIDAEPGYIENGGRVFSEIPETPYPQLEQTNANMQMDMMDAITPLNPANEGRNESSKETGVLFERKREQGEINLTTINKAVESFWEEVGQVYLRGAQQLYSGTYRSFQSGKSGDVVELNKPEQSIDGKVYNSNNLADLPNCKVVVTLSPNGITQRVNDRISTIELIRVLPQEAVVSKMALFQKAVKTLDNYTEAEREDMDKLLELEKTVIQSQLEAQLAGNKASSAQAEAMIGQLQQQAQAQQAQAQQAQQGAPQEQGPSGDQVAQGMAQSAGASPEAIAAMQAQAAQQGGGQPGQPGPQPDQAVRGAEQAGM